MLFNLLLTVTSVFMPFLFLQNQPPLTFESGIDYVSEYLEAEQKDSSEFFNFDLCNVVEHLDSTYMVIGATVKDNIEQSKLDALELQNHFFFYNKDTLYFFLVDMEDASTRFYGFQENFEDVPEDLYPSLAMPPFTP